VALFIMNL